jgi:phage-related protein (TIGR01555 family)
MPEQYSFFQSWLKRITPDVVAGARGGRLRRWLELPGDRRSSVAVAAPGKLRLPDFPAGVKPAEPTLAMDSAFGELNAWTAGSILSGSINSGYTFFGYAALSELAQVPEYRALTEVIASEMTREWIELKSTSTVDKKVDRIKQLNDAMEEFDLRGAFQKCAAYDGFFGRGHIYIDTGRTDDREELPLDIGTGWNELSRMRVPKGSLKAFRPIEPVWTYPTQYDAANPLKEDWYKPVTWFVMGNAIHRSSLLTFVGREAPDLLKPTYAFGGLAMSQMAKPYVDNWLRTRQAVADIIRSFSVFVLSTDMQSTLQVGGEQLFSRLELFNILRDNSGVLAIDKNSEEFKNISASLASLDALQAQTQEHMAAIGRIPLVKLLGIQPAGLNASSEGEIRTFYDWIAAFQELLFRPNLHACLGFLMLHLWGEVDREIVAEFKPLWQLDEVALVGVQKTKMDIYDAAVAMGAVAPEEVREQIAVDHQSPFSTIDLSDSLPTSEPGIDPVGHPGTETLTPGGELHPRDPSNRLASSLSSKAANFGKPVSGGFAPDIMLNQEKDAKEDVHYVYLSSDPTKRCAVCVNFLSPHGCELVAGLISPSAGCSLFELK